MPILHVQSLNFNFRLTTAFILKLWFALGYSRKIQTGTVRIEDMELPGNIKEKAC